MLVELFQPRHPREQAARNRLLQSCLRPEPLPFPIDAEYPLVLDSQAETSYCQRVGGQLVAHANLWPRRVLTSHGQGVGSVGLIGNVATAKPFRGQGIMRAFLEALMERAREHQLDAVLLWSDLEVFYQKLGFRALAQELRYHVRAEAACALTPELVVPAVAATPALCARLLRLRQHLGPSLERSPEEFARLLTIPQTYLLVEPDLQRPQTYLIVGKGYDMAGVVHEWGARDPRGLVRCVAGLAALLEQEAVMLLAPKHLRTGWHAALVEASVQVETRPMALGRALTATPWLDDLFVWGLDSI